MTDPLLGAVVRGYRIERLLAAGGMGAVYLARDTTLPNVVKVVKVLLPDMLAHPKMRAVLFDRFEKEGLATSVLRHDNIVAVHAAGQLDNGVPYILMDYVEGRTLQEVLQVAGRVPAYRVLRYVCYVARALDFAHGLGIVHRDLKPSNVMVVPKDWDAHFSVLLDFGTAKITRPLSADRLMPTMTGMALGTPYFMAPEQFRGEEDATPQMDLYALAVMIWYLATGEFPWGTVDLQTPLGLADLCERQLTRPPNPPPQGTLPAGWIQVLSLALSRDPADRPLSVRHLIVDLGNELPSPGGSYVKSGTEVVREICPRFISELGPQAETVRDQQHPTIVVAWPRAQEPSRPAVADMRTWTTTPGRLVSGTPSPTPVLTELPSTLSASNGVMQAGLAQSTRLRWGPWVGAVAAAAIGFAVAFMSSRVTGSSTAVVPSVSPSSAAPAIGKAAAGLGDAAPNDVRSSDEESTGMPARAPKQPAPEPKQMAPEPKQMAPEPKQMAPEPKQTAPAVKQTAPAVKQTAPAVQMVPAVKQTAPAATPNARGDARATKAGVTLTDAKFNPNAAAGD